MSLMRTSLLDGQSIVSVPPANLNRVIFKGNPSRLENLEQADARSLCDRLAAGQELRFGVDGITLIYGDNGSGKSGYSRIAKKLCLARVVDPLQGDVFANQASPPARVRVRYRLPGAAEPQAEDWVDGMPRPASLSRMMVLDSANARVYVDGKNEITYLPHEIEIATRLGLLCTSLSTELQNDAEAIAGRLRAAFGTGYAQTTRAGRLVARLMLETPLGGLPDEAALREAATWDAALQAELAELNVALAQDPAAQAAARRRIIPVLEALAAQIDGVTRALDADAVTRLRARMAGAAEAAAAAGLAAQELFAGGPIPQTGQVTGAEPIFDPKPCRPARFSASTWGKVADF